MKKVIDGILAGLMISLGGAVFLGCYNESRIFGAILFSVGLLAVCIKGYNLFTGKVGLIVTSHTKEDFSVLLLGLLGNAIGSIAVGYLLQYATPNLAETALVICNAKLSQGLLRAFIRGIFCGILIYLAVDVYKNHKSVLGIIFGVPAFILSGFEHSIADMFYFATSGIASFDAFLYILIIIAGNAIGGMFIPALNLLSKVNFKKKSTKNAEIDKDNTENHNSETAENQAANTPE